MLSEEKKKNNSKQKSHCNCVSYGVVFLKKKNEKEINTT